MWASMRFATASTRTRGIGALPAWSRESAGVNQPLLGRMVSREQAGSLRKYSAEEYFRSAEPWRPQVKGSSSILFACLKPAYHGLGKVLRLYESAGMAGGAGKAGEVELSGMPAGCQVWETNITEDKLSECTLVDGRLRLAFRPWQVRTFLVDTSGRVLPTG